MDSGAGRGLRRQARTPRGAGRATMARRVARVACHMSFTLIAATLFVVTGALVTAGLLASVGRRTRARHLWQSIVDQIEARGITLMPAEDLENLEVSTDGWLAPGDPALAAHATAGAKRVTLAVGHDELMEVRSRQPEGFRAGGSEHLLGYTRRAGYGALLAERQRIKEQEIPRVEARRRQLYERFHVVCPSCQGSGDDGSVRGCASCGGTGQRINTAILDELPIMPRIPSPVDAVRVIFLYRA